VALLILGAAEWYAGVSLKIFERRNVQVATDPASVTTESPNFSYLGRGEPVSFWESVRARAVGMPVVFVGDSQGAGARDHGPGYPEIVAARLAGGDTAGTVVSLHVGGANAYEQGVMLLTMLRAGVTPRAVVWSHSIFSQRKNEIRAEYATAYELVAGDLDRMAASVVAPPSPVSTAEVGDPARRLAMSATSKWSSLLSRSALVRFMRRPLWDKVEILRRSPAGSILPAKLRPGTARQFDPPASILRESARFVEEVTLMLRERGVRVVHFVAPINRAASPRPFSQRAESACYPALQAAAQAGDATFIDLLDVMPPERFGAYQDGTPDAFHLDGVAHAELADRFMAELAPGRSGSGKN